MNERVMHSPLGGMARRFRFLSGVARFRERQRKEENGCEMRFFQGKMDRNEADTLSANSRNAVPVVFTRWGLCNKCEQSLLGRVTTVKPAELICLGCLQSDQKSPYRREENHG